MGEMNTQIQVENGNAIFKSTQDCTPILEHATKLHNEGIHGSNEMRHAARFPQVLVEKYLAEKNILFSEFMANPVHIKTMLNDSALAGFRIWPGKV